MTASHTHERLTELTEQRCWELAATRPIGRLAWSGGEGVTVMPVNFLLDGHDVVIRTSSYGLLGREGHERQVAFEIDAIDEEQHTGWSILLRGRCRRDHHAGDGPDPWATGPRVLRLRIEVSSVTGRRLGVGS